MRFPSIALCFIGMAYGQDNVTYVKPSCYDNTTLLAAHLVMKDSFIPDEFILCPNSVFDIGSTPRDDVLCCKDGMSPLYGEANSRILCGEDGKSSNNCTLRGGAVQFSSVFANVKHPIESMQVSGVTFEGATLSSIFLGNVGDVTFKDCIVKDNTVGSPVTSFSSFAVLAGESGRHKVIFDSVQFLNNRPGPRTTGIVQINDEHDDVVMTGCLFKGNDFSSVEESYAVQYPEGATLKIEKSCFIDNAFNGNGVIVSDSPNGLDHSNNYAIGNEGTSCGFIAIKSNESDPQCIDHDLLSCFGDDGVSGGEKTSAAAILQLTHLLGSILLMACFT